MNPDIFMKKIRKLLCITVFSFTVAFVLFCVAARVIPHESENTANVFDSTVRLRVVANSDSDSDQALKLAVRNDIIGMAADIFAGCSDIDSAKAAVNSNMHRLLETAKSSVKKNGSDLPVSISFGTEKCPVRRYSDFTFPAGEYMTLRIDLGKGAGENWWCVMYPPLCVSAATNDVYADVMTFRSYGFDDGQISMLLGRDAGNKPQVRWALFEFLDKILD